MSKKVVLETYKDVPDEIRDELYIEDQQKQEKEKRKGYNVLGGKTPYPPININVHPSHSPGLTTTAPAVDSAVLKGVVSLKIPGFKAI